MTDNFFYEPILRVGILLKDQLHFFKKYQEKKSKKTTKMKIIVQKILKNKIKSETTTPSMKYVKEKNAAF